MNIGKAAYLTLKDGVINQLPIFKRAPFWPNVTVLVAVWKAAGILTLFAAEI